MQQENIVLNTIEEVRALFSEQLKAAHISSGNYLAEVLNVDSFEEGVDKFFNSWKDSEFSISYEDAVEILERNVREYSKHEGQACLFYMTMDSPLTQYKMMRIWENELGELVGKGYIPNGSVINIPRFIVE